MKNRGWIFDFGVVRTAAAVKAAAYSAAAADAENGAGVDFKPAAAAAAGDAKPTVSVLPALVRTFWPQFFFGASIKLVQDLLAFVSPILLKYGHVASFFPKGEILFLILFFGNLAGI